MKHLIWIALIALLISACSKDENTTPAAEEPADNSSVAESVDETTPANEDSTTDESNDEETQNVVEESAADTEAEDTTLMLAKADVPAPPAEFKYREGEHFTRMVPTQPTVGGADKIEVAEIFMYSCPHCLTLEPYINNWAQKKDPNVRFVRIPAVFNPVAQVHAQLFYTEEVLVRDGKIKDPEGFRAMIFQEFHNRGNRLANEDAVQRVFERAGVSKEDFSNTWKSFEVNQKMRVGADLARRYNVQSVPMVVVNGKYRTDAGSAGGYTNLMELIDELTVREGLR